jgi:diacylglycerol kinase family enzyme
MRRLFVLSRRAAHGDPARLREVLRRSSRPGVREGSARNDRGHQSAGGASDENQLLIDPTAEVLLDAAERLDPDRGRLVVVGGDGTVNRILQVVGPRRCVLGLLPAGRANDLASQIGVPGNWTAALRLLDHGRVDRVDVAEVNGRFFVTAGGIGLPALVADRANEGRPGSWWSYPRAACREAWTYANGAEVRVYGAGRDWHDAPLAVIWSNQPRFGRRFRLSPGASNRDGLLDCCAIADPKHALARLRVVAEALCGSPACERRFWHGRAEVWSVEAAHPLPFFGDGEILDTARTFTIRLLPGALRVVVPEEPCG